MVEALVHSPVSFSDPMMKCVFASVTGDRLAKDVVPAALIITSTEPLEWTAIPCRNMSEEDSEFIVVAHM